jgi:hypothetical protein
MLERAWASRARGADLAGVAPLFVDRLRLEGCAVTFTAPNLVDVGAGSFVFNGAPVNWLGGSIAIVAPSGNPRIDLVVLGLAPGGIGAPLPELKVIQGDDAKPGELPSAKAVPSDKVLVARVTTRLGAKALDKDDVVAVRRRVLWDHLIYAYLIENTRIYDIFWRVIREFTSGERLGVPRQPATYDWLRTTEELLYSYGIPFLTSSVVTQIRPDVRAMRRNAYYRMFGMDLNHGSDTGQPYPYDKAAESNRDFVGTFELFLRETWRAIENRKNALANNPTDVAAIADLALRLQNMLTLRRGGTSGGMSLAREEFAAVAAMSWLHLALYVDTPIVQDLQAQASSPEERLRKIGERVGVPSHANSHSYFILAPRVSELLNAIEQGIFSSTATATVLYTEPPGTPIGTLGPISENVMVIIDQWSRATGRNLKAMAVAATPPAPLTGRAPVTASQNGGAATSARQLVKV